MTTPDPIKFRILKLLGTEALRPLIKALDRRFGKRDDLEGTLTISKLPPETIDAVTALLGKPPTSATRLTLRIRELETAIANATGGIGLIDAITIVLDRPPQHPAQQLRDRKRRLEFAAATLEGQLHESGIPRPEVIHWILRKFRSASMRRQCQGDLSVAKIECLRLCDLIAGLPLFSPQSLPVFAAQRLGDSHALDRGQPMRRWLAEAIDELLIPEPSTSHNRETPTKMSEAIIRDLFGRVGIVANDLSSDVLVLNLNPDGDDFLANQLRCAAQQGEPARITFRMLTRWNLTFPDDHGMVSVCENPSVVAEAANRLAAACRPLICIEGFPSHAASLLCQRLQAAGVMLRYHGDFDAGGLAIAKEMIDRGRMQPWRMSSQDYTRHSHQSNLKIKHTSKLPETPWSPDLSQQMRACGMALLEETVLELLLSDLNPQNT